MTKKQMEEIKGILYLILITLIWKPLEILILAVGNKYEGETRHQTALRYIKQAEEGSSEPSQEKQTLKKKIGEGKND